MDEFEIIKQKDRYDELSASEKQALKDLCDNEQSFIQIKALTQQAEDAMPVRSPEHIHEQLLALYDASYPIVRKESPRSIPLYWYVVAAAAIVLLVFLLYPLTQKEATAPPVAYNGGETKPLLPKAKDTVTMPTSQGEEKSLHHHPQPLIAKTEPASLVNQKDIQNPAISQVDQVKEPALAAASIKEEDGVSKTANEVIASEQELLNSKNVTQEWADHKDKAKTAKSKKWVTSSMLKNIRPVF